MQAFGLQKTHSSSHLETDSGAAGTAMSCGVKTFNSGIGVDADSIPVQSIMQLARLGGLATGFVVTSSVVHATPACFYAHSASRGSYEDIAKQLVKADIDVFVGGGERFFIDRKSDKVNLIDALQYAGYEVIRNFDADDRFRFDYVKREKSIACFTAHEDPMRASMGRTYLPRAVMETIRALERRSDKGYFLMVEASQVDWAAHANDANWLAFEMQDAFDTMDVILRHLEEDPNTLLIVTADHECGYISIKGKRAPRVEFNAKVHSSQMVPVMAAGPGADDFAGIYDNTEIFAKMKALLGL
jgi:alkaline phosphatase